MEPASTNDPSADMDGQAPILALCPKMRIMGDEALRYLKEPPPERHAPLAHDVAGTEKYTFIHFHDKKDFYDWIMTVSMSYGPDCFQQLDGTDAAFQMISIGDPPTEKEYKHGQFGWYYQLKMRQGADAIDIIAHIGPGLSYTFSFLSAYSVFLDKDKKLRLMDSRRTTGAYKRLNSVKIMPVAKPGCRLLDGGGSSLLAAVWCALFKHMLPPVADKIFRANGAELLSDPTAHSTLQLPPPVTMRSYRERISAVAYWKRNGVVIEDIDENDDPTIID